MAAVLRWMVFLLLLMVAAGSCTAYWFYTRSDEVLRLAILQQLKTIAPTLKFDIARANCDLTGRVRIYGLTCALPGDDRDRPSLDISEITASLTDFENFDNFVIQKLYIVRPKLRAIRTADGSWNWQQATFKLVPGTPLPEIEIADGLVDAQFQLPNTKSRLLRFHNFNISAHPENSKRFSIQVATMLKPAGPWPLTLKIDAATDGSTWQCSSRNPWRVPIDQERIELLADLSPEFAEQARKLSRKINDAKSQPLDAMNSADANSSVPDFGVACDCQLTFQLQKEKADAPVTVKAQAEIQKGSIHNDLLFMPIDEISGTIYVDPRHIIVKNLRGSRGQTQIAFDSKIVPSTPISASLKLRNVDLNDELKARLPASLRRIVQSMALTGICDADASVVQDGGKWVPKVDLRLSKGTVTHERYPVTVREVVGRLRLENDIIDYKAVGRYAGQVVESDGVIRNPGPELEADITVKANNLPTDDESLAACPIEVRKVIDSLRLKCRRDVVLRVTRPAGPQQKFEPELTERIYNGTLQFKDFPYSVEKLKGLVHWKGDLVEFTELSGVHDGTTLVGQGTYQRLPAPGRLNLAINATNAAFDRSLQNALPASLQRVWSNFQPQGLFDVKTRISWVPGSPCEVILPSIKVREGEVLMTSFPWSLQKLKGEFSYNTEPGKLVIKEVKAQHDDTVLIGKGIGWFSAQQPWHLQFDQLDVDNLSPNTTFRNALPASLKQTFDFLNPSGVFSFHGPAEFREIREGDCSIGATWKLRTVLSGCSMNAGTRIDDIVGVVQLNGAWDGLKTTLDGDLNLDSITIFRQASGRNYRITGIRGPISLRDNKFVAGTESAIPPRKSDTPDSSKRIRGQAIDGTVFLDAVVNLNEGPKYTAFAELKNGRLESYAHEFLRCRNRLSGVMNSYVILNGKGSDIDRLTGEGKLVIDHAELYDSPLFAQIFQIMKMQSPDKALFETAAANFTIENSRFNLNSIELLGDTLSVRGRGYVRFDGDLQLNFGVRLRQWQVLPNNLTAVKIFGTMNDPKSEIVPLPALDGALRQFFKTFDPRQMTPRSGLFDPLTGQNSDAINR